MKTGSRFKTTFVGCVVLTAFCGSVPRAYSARPLNMTIFGANPSSVDWEKVEAAVNGAVESVIETYRARKDKVATDFERSSKRTADEFIRESDGRVAVAGAEQAAFQGEVAKVSESEMRYSEARLLEKLSLVKVMLRLQLSDELSAFRSDHGKTIEGVLHSKPVQNRIESLVASACANGEYKNCPEVIVSLVTQVFNEEKMAASSKQGESK